MDTATIRSLLTEARKAHRVATKLFEKHDNHEDMDEMDRWEATVTWLEGKLPK